MLTEKPLLSSFPAGFERAGRVIQAFLPGKGKEPEVKR
jgi:hypothetical protein